METSKRQYYKQKIIDLIEKTQSDINSLKELTKPISPDNAIGRLSRMEAIAEKSVNQKALDNAKFQLDQLKNALQRVETEDYGYCVICDEPIPEKRLELLPQSVSCVKCLNKKQED